MFDKGMLSTQMLASWAFAVMIVAIVRSCANNVNLIGVGFIAGSSFMFLSFLLHFVRLVVEAATKYNNSIER